MTDNLLAELKQITTFIFDVDGVLTDGTLTLHPSGEYLRNIHTHDDVALVRAVKAGYRVAVITRARSKTLQEHLNWLGIYDLYQDITDKAYALDEFLITYDLQPENVLYMGDDEADIPVLEQVGFPCCPPNAAERAKAVARLITRKSGGEGCVREIIEKTLKLQGTWDKPQAESTTNSAPEV